VGVNANVIS